MLRATGGSKSSKNTKACAQFPLVEDIFDEPDGGPDIYPRRTILQPHEMRNSSDDDSDDSDDDGGRTTSKGSATGGATKKAAKGVAAAGRLPRGGAAGLPLDLSSASGEKSSTRKGKGNGKSKPVGGAETAVDLSSEEPHQPHERAKKAKATTKSARPQENQEVRRCFQEHDERDRRCRQGSRARHSQAEDE